MEINLNVIRAMFHSLAAGEKIYKFSELRDLLAKENVDVSGFNLRRKADQQALLSVAEKCIYDLEREERVQIDIQEFEDAVNNESDYPDIPLTYAWQFEGVDDSKDCFLHPMTPLTCDVLGGQFCKLPVSNKGSGQIKPIQVESAVIPLPYVGEVVGYRLDSREAKWLDLDDLTDALEVAFSPKLENVEIHQVKPISGKYRNQIRRAIRVEESTKVIERASDLGNERSVKLYHDMVGHGMREAGVKGAVVFAPRARPKDGRVIPHDADGNLIEELAFDTTVPNLLVDGWLLVENYLKYSTERDDGDYTNLPMVINLVVASIANRKQSKISRREAVGLLQQLCPFFNDIGQLENLSEALRQDDEIYRVLCKDMLSEARKQALTNPFELPDFIKECTEVKSMIEARASKDPNIKLINDWLHPLSEVKEDIPGTEGQPYCNAWQFASLIVGAATRRCPNTDAHGAITILVDFDVIESEKSVEIEQAKSDDAVYLQLVNAMKEAFDLDFERQLNSY